MWSDPCPGKWAVSYFAMLGWQWPARVSSSWLMWSGFLPLLISPAVKGFLRRKVSGWSIKGIVKDFPRKFAFPLVVSIVTSPRSYPKGRTDDVTSNFSFRRFVSVAPRAFVAAAAFFPGT